METTPETTDQTVDSGTSANATGHAPLSVAELYSLVAILSVFSITGTIGNALAFYVFSTLKKHKLTSTIFILALAGTDFFTCLVTIPFTITVELLDFHLQVDFFCKLYHFLVTTTVPFSAFVMVVIAVDRYLCICHPFLHWMTQRRAKIIIACLALFIFCIGAIICLHYTIYEVQDVTIDLFEGNDTFSSSSSSSSSSSHTTNVTLSAETDNASIAPTTSHNTSKRIQSMSLPSQCDWRVYLVNAEFFNALQRIYSSFFLISCVAVLILYSLIYHSVVTQRRKKLKIRSANCCFLWDSSGVANGEPSEVTVALELSQVNGENTKIRPDDFTTTAGTGEESALPTNGSSRAPLSRVRIERARMANIKTAVMLFVVTIVFIFSFLPAWLYALKIIQAPVIVFYMYFFYNVVNPFIYAFMNQNFRTELKNIFHCKQ